MPDTDSRMMRHQQDMDTPQRISEDETHRKPGRSDSDPASARDREAAKRGEAQDANEQMDAAFAGNRRAAAADVAESEMLEDAATDGNASLARSNRSRLGD